MFNLKFFIMSNPISMLRHKANLSRTGFDVSQSFAFTASTGMILPVYSDFLNSGETIYATTDLFARTQPLVTPAMADVDIYIDWFFVPMTMLFTGWGQIRYQTSDFISSYYNSNSLSEPDVPGANIVPNNSTSYFPLFNMSSLQTEYSSDDMVTLRSYNASTSLYGAIYLPTTLFESSIKSTYRLLDCLGFNPRNVFPSSTSSTPPSGNPNVFPWKALAYQCIYQNYFRNDDFEQRNILTYNVDYWFKGSYNNPYTLSNRKISDFSQPTTASYYNSNSPFILRYCDYRKDYFTSIKPSPILSGLNVLTNSNSQSVLMSVRNFLDSSSFGSATNSSSGTSIQTSNLNTPVTQVQSPVPNPSSSGYRNTTGNLRSLFAIEKLLRITGRAAKDYDSQVLAHLGFEVPHDVKHDITHLHSSHGVLHIGEVISTSDTFNGSSGSALGELAGKGYVSIHDNHKIKFTAPVDGCLMATFRAVPRFRVDEAFDRQNAVAQRTDLYIPEFDKLGMQPLYSYEYARGAMNTAGTLGWKLRYSQFKEKYDRVSSAFSSNTRNQGINQYSSWVLTYRPFGGTPSTDINTAVVYLKCPPTSLNNIMAVPYQTTVSDPSTFLANPFTEFYTDPFICDFRANVKKVSTMSRTGEPDMVSL